MALSFPLTFSLSPLPTGFGLDANAYGQQLVANLSASISGQFLTGQIGGTQPTQNVGPWLNNNQWYVWNGSTYVAQTVTSLLVPTGAILAYGGPSAPSGFLNCDGSLYLRSTYSALFAVIGGSYNNGDGSSTFGVPDLRGRTTVGVGTGPGLSARNMGDTFGEETHILASGEMPVHNHGITDPGHGHTLTDPGHNHSHTDPGHNHSHSDPGHIHGTSDPGHVHGYSDPGHSHGYNTPFIAGGAFQGGGTYQMGTTATGSATVGITISSAGTGLSILSHTTSITNVAATTGIVNVSTTTGITLATHTTGVTTVNTGGGSSHNNLQPSTVVNFIIKS